MPNTIKATRVSISLGAISLNGYQMPDGSYRLAGRNVTDAIDVQHKSLGEVMGVKSLKQLPGADLAWGNIKADTGESFVPVALEDASKYWLQMALKGNQKAAAITEACLVEALERRFDEAFNIVKSEAERNLLFKARTQGIQTRRSWSDAVKDWVVKKGLTKNPKGIHCYRNATEKLYKLCFGLSCKQMKLQFGENCRDNLSEADLRFLDLVETLAMFLIDQFNAYPVDAVEQVFKNNSLKSRIPQGKLELKAA
ncbi:MAG: hypothetical protein KME43_19275 [Myxacorys chilensis ATA2-1-KO14]|jgi:hypothetical protein|nr:hypothetical protein [Myxacorys chilensis ATA2-1-KO14]